jgi:predicted protein tyrosine phosphatase
MFGFWPWRRVLTKSNGSEKKDAKNPATAEAVSWVDVVFLPRWGSRRDLASEKLECK